MFTAKQLLPLLQITDLYLVKYLKITVVDTVKLRFRATGMTFFCIWSLCHVFVTTKMRAFLTVTLQSRATRFLKSGGVFLRGEMGGLF